MGDAKEGSHMIGATFDGLKSAVASGKTYEECIRAMLISIKSENEHLQCFEYVAIDEACADAKRLDCMSASELAQLPLAGLAVGVKDIIDAEGMRTDFGCEAPIGYVADRDSWLVKQLKQRGAIVIGKAVTCELAGGFPSRTKNPKSDSVTPGGSSSGSAAAVSAKLCPLAIGTQTGGSIIRPSSFCGVFAIKPTFNLIDRMGTYSTCPSLDTLGFMANNLDDLFSVMKAISPNLTTRPTGFDNGTLKVAVLRDDAVTVASAEACMLKLLDDTAARLDASDAFTVTVLSEDIGVPRILELHKIISKFEVHYKNNDVCTKYPDKVSEKAKMTHHEGSKYTATEYFAAIEEVGNLRAAFRVLLSEKYDCFLLPSAPGEAPALKDDITGNPVFNSPTTMLGLPCVTMPLGTGPSNLPLGLQVMGQPLGDLDVITMAMSIFNAAQ